jgi:hypothetical protein
MIYTLARLEMCIGAEVVWEKYNTTSGRVDVLLGNIVSCGSLPMCSNTEYVRVMEKESGHTWLTVPAQIKEVR